MNWRSLRELDEAAGAAKGSAFRAFKQRAATLVEGQDYRLLHHDHDRQEIAGLREQNRLYASSINVVLVSNDIAEALLTSAKSRPVTQR